MTAAWTPIALIVVALIAGLSGYAAQQAAARASTKSAATASRGEVEKDAYVRAESFLTGTITRRDAEIENLRIRVDELVVEVRNLIDEMAKKDRRIRRQDATIAAHDDDD